MVSVKARNARKMDYKNHHIEVSVRSVTYGSGWMPDVFVMYNENGKHVLKSLRMDQAFAAPDEADKPGSDMQKKVDR
jgi:hypothetical protein